MAIRRLQCSVLIHLVAFFATMVGAATIVRADMIYGFTSTHLIKFDSTTPSVFLMIGPHGMAQGVSIFSSAFNPSDGKAYSFAYRPNGEVLFLRFDVATGAGTTLATIGNGSSTVFGGLAYSNSLSAMVASQGVNGSQSSLPRLGTITTAGVFSMLSSNNTNNYRATYDALRDRFYTFGVGIGDPNTEANLVAPLSGNTSIVGVAPTHLGGVAWAPIDDAIFGVKGTSPSYLLQIATGTTFFTPNYVALPQSVQTIFTVPSPSTLSLLGFGIVLLTTRRRF